MWNKYKNNTENSNIQNLKRLPKRNKIDKNILKEIFLHFRANRKVMRLRSIYLEYKKKIRRIPEFSIETLRRFLIQQCGIRYGRIKIRNSKVQDVDTPNAKKVFLVKFMEHLENGRTFLYIDECGFNNEGSTRFGWKFPNEDNYITNKGRIKSVNLVYAHDQYRSIYFELNKNTYNRFSFLKFLNGLLDFIKNDFDLAQKLEDKKICILLDNVLLHHCKIIKKFAIENEIFLLYNFLIFLTTWLLNRYFP